MAELTPEERQNIYLEDLEEKARLEVRRELEGQKTSAGKLIGVVILDGATEMKIRICCSRIITTALVMVACGSAQTTPTAAPALTDLWAIQARLEDLKAKDAFETTAQYNSRLAAAFQVPSTLNVSVGESGVSVRYDADRAVLTVALKTSAVPRILNTLPTVSGSADFMNDNDPLHPEAVLECDSKLKSERTYPASNAYGKEVMVHESFMVTVGLALYGARWHVAQPDLLRMSVTDYMAASDRAREAPVFRLNMDPATARETVPHLHLIVTGSPRNTAFIRGSYYKEAKIDSPTEILSYTYLIPVDITQALLVDDRTSTVVANTTPQVSASTPQAQHTAALQPHYSRLVSQSSNLVTRSVSRFKTG
jgi:hypothetical protein